MKKEYVIGLLNTAINNYSIGCLAGYFIQNAGCKIIPDDLKLTNLNYPQTQVTLDLKPMKKMILEKEKRDHLLVEHIKSVLRTLIKDTYETVKFYAKETDQPKRMKKADWYNFTRIIRNCLSHDNRLRFEDWDKEILPVRWRDKEITIDMDNQPLSVHIMNDAIAIQLFYEIYQFVEDKLD